MKKGVTLKDIAVKLNMSVSTVSKALSDDLSISLPTRERVKTLASEWQYIPNEAARHFKQNKTFTLGLIIPDLMDQFYVLGINGVEEIAAQYQYNTIVSQSHEDTQKELRIVDLMIRNRVDGVIVAIAKNTTDMSPFRRLQRMGIPVVFFARAPIEPSFDYVSADNEDGAVKAIEFFFQRGHRRIAHLKGPSVMPVSDYRLEGYKRALVKKGIPYDASLVKEIDFTTNSTNAAVKSLMEMPEPPTALFIFKNYVSLQAIHYLKEHFPEKVNTLEIAGFGNLPLLQYLDTKPVASIEENAHLMGREAMRLLLKKIDSPAIDEDEIHQHIKVPCLLVLH